MNFTSLLRTLWWSDESRIPIRWICIGWIPSGWWAMQGDFKTPVAVYQTTICERCTEEHNRLFRTWITTDSIKIFSITFCTLVTVYFTCKIAKDAFRIVLYVTTFYMQHCAVPRFVLKHWFVYNCTYFVANMYNVVGRLVYSPFWSGSAGSQCTRYNIIKTSVICSFFTVSVTILAAAFWTFCKRSMR